VTGGKNAAVCLGAILVASAGSCSRKEVPLRSGPDAGLENQKILQYAVSRPGTVWLPKGIFHVRSPVNLVSPVRLKGHDCETVLRWREPEPLFRITPGGRGIARFSDFTAEGPIGTWVVFADSTSSFQLRNIFAMGSGLLTSYARPGVAPEVDGTREVINCTAWGSEKSVTAINLRFLWNVEVRGNRLHGYRHGVTIWGGESNQAKNTFDGTLWGAGRIRVADNIITGTYAGGIWTSRAQDVTMTRNIIHGCGDVGLDAEGSRNVFITDNVVADCSNGGLTVFFSSDNVRFERNIAAATRAAWPLARVHNSSRRPKEHTGLVFGGNTFITFDPDGMPGKLDNRKGPASGLQILGNNFWNSMIDLSVHSADGTRLSGNRMIFTNAIKTNDPMIRLGPGETGATITDNTFISLRHPSIPAAIRIEQSPPEVGGPKISENLFTGFERPVAGADAPK